MDHSAFPAPISSHSYQPLAQSESQNLPSQHPPQASIPSSEPSFFPSMSSQAPSQHAGGTRDLQTGGMTDGFGSLRGHPDAQPGGGPPMNGTQAYNLGPDPSSIPQPGQPAATHLPGNAGLPALKNVVCPNTGNASTVAAVLKGHCIICTRVGLPFASQ